MPKFYIVFCCVVLIGLMTATHTGTVFASLFYAAHVAGGAGNHYHK